MMSINDWKEEADKEMKRYAIKDSEKFNFWLGFSSGLDKAKDAVKNSLED